MQHVQLLVPCSLALCLMAVFIIKFISNSNGHNEDVQDIIVGILSARDNFVQRNAIRATWINFMHENNKQVSRRYKIAHRFIVGSEDCEVPPEYRLSEFSCEWDPYVGPNQEQDVFAYKVSEDSKSYVESLPMGLDFEVLHPIIISKLGVIAISNEIEFSIRVALFDRTTKREVVSAYINKSDPVVNGFWIKTVDSYLLPKEFKGSLVVDSNGHGFGIAENNGPCNINDGGGLVKFSKIIRHGPIPGYFPNKVVEKKTFCSRIAGTFVYKSEDADNWVQGQTSKRIAERTEKLKQWEDKVQDNRHYLNEESGKYNDILIVDVKDHYRNIPRKLLKFYKWASSISGLQFAIKTDDDCYLNIPKIIQEISSMNLSSQDNLWYGSFRFNWPVDLFGKWAENEYQSSVYPAFACGSGNLISKHVLDWIALNSNYLHSYQGEDVSMAIWLSAILPKIKNDEHWSCFKICDKNMLSLPDNNPKEILSLYENHLTCSNPCGCNL